MRELTVYYCPKCGRYGYYQLVKKAVCAECGVKMEQLAMAYPDFIHLDQGERDKLISDEILKNSPSISYRILAADRAHNERRTVAALQSRIQELEEDNKQLNDTIAWMHQTIWDLLAKSKALERQLNSERDPSDL